MDGQPKTPIVTSIVYGGNSSTRRSAVHYGIRELLNDVDSQKHA